LQALMPGEMAGGGENRPSWLWHSFLASLTIAAWWECKQEGGSGGGDEALRISEHAYIAISRRQRFCAHRSHLPEAAMNTETPASAEPLTLQPLRPDELASGESRLSWLWQGYLASGKITALISPPKSGKTTLLAHLLARLAQGGQLAGRAVMPGR